MMVPAWILVPSNTFTPRRCAFESRPLRVDPPPLVFDIAGSSALRDRDDLDDGVLLTMAVTTALVLLLLVREPVDLRALGHADDLARHRGAREGVGTGQHRVSVDNEHGSQRDLAALVTIEQLERHLLALGHLFLLAARGDDCVHSSCNATGSANRCHPTLGDGRCQAPTVSSERATPVR